MGTESGLITIFSDGACSGNPGPGGYAAALLCPGGQYELSGREDLTTNNRMELMGVIAGIGATEAGSLKIVSDSQYVIGAFTQGWLKNWKRKGWRSSSGPVKNRDLWERLSAAIEGRDVQWVKVKGHSGDQWNEHVDELARQAVKGRTFGLRLVGTADRYSSREEHFRAVRL
jgi:ribonuclease HI